MNSIIMLLKLNLFLSWIYEYSKCNPIIIKQHSIFNNKINVKNKQRKESIFQYKEKKYYSKRETNNNNYYYSDSLLRKLNENETICLKSDEVYKKFSLCKECNTKEGYYPVINDYSENNIQGRYVKCYNEETKPNNVYFNKDLQVFERCYESCETCFGYGDTNNNNCSSCKEGYIFKPEISNTKNCVEKCKYYYYFSLDGIYSCTENYYCPNEANLVIEDLNKCVYDCKSEKEYKYQYNGECLKSCPENTTPNQLNICIDNDIEKCYFTKKIMKIEGEMLNSNILNIIVKRFVEEFSYTNNHFSQFITENYSLLFYKNKSCLSLFSSNYTIVEFNGCNKKINDFYNLPSPLIFVFDRINKYNSILTSIFVFHPINGDLLDIEFCNSMQYTYFKNISQIYDKDKYQKFIDHNIDIYDLSNDYYNSLCNNYNKIFKVDLLMKYRILYYYPNITICDLNCEYKTTNYKTKTTKCDCKYKKFNFSLINRNNNYDDEINFQTLNMSVITLSNIVYELEDSKVASLFCIKIALYPKNFITNIGGIFILIILIVQIICCFQLIKDKFLHKISKFINLIMSLYIDKLKKKKLRKSIKNQRLSYNLNQDNSKNDIPNIKPDKIRKCNSFPLKTTYDINNDIKITNEPQNSNKNIGDEVTDISIINSENSFKISDNANEKEVNKYIKLKLNRKSVMNLKNLNTVKSENEDGYNEFDLREYLTKSPDDLTFYKALKKDKRSFFMFLINMIVKKNLIVQTFFMVEESKPIFLKIILFTFHMNLLFFLNTIFLFASDIYSLNMEKSFISYAKLAITKVIASIFINKVAWFLIDFFIFDKYTLMDMIKLEKDDENILRKETIKLIKSVKIKYIIFFIIDLIIIILSWIFVLSFNYVYPNIKIFIFIMCIFIIILEYLFSVALVFIEACLRFISFKFKMKAIFTLSKYINEIN